MSEKLKIEKTSFELQKPQLSISANVFALFNNSTLSLKPKQTRIEEDEDAIREYEDQMLIMETPKPKPPPPPKSPPRINANSKLFASRESLEKTAINMSSGSLTSKKIELLPEAIRNFVILNPGFIRDLMKDHDVTAHHLLLLSYSELMQLQMYWHNVNQLVDAGIPMSKLLSLDSTSRNIFIYNADAIVSLMKQGNTFEQLSKLSNNDLMNCVHEHRASEASQSSTAAAQGPS